MRPSPLVLVLWSVPLASGCVAEDLASTAASSEGEASSGGTTDGDVWRPVATSTDAQEDPRQTPEDVQSAPQCAPGEVEVCPYHGPPGTLAVGACRAGSRACGDDERWGPCAGEVLPAAEDCSTKTDENCDGEVACDGALVWARSFGPPAGEAAGWSAVSGATVDPSGRLWFAGHRTLAWQFGDEQWTPMGSKAYFMARVDPDGAPEFAWVDGQADTDVEDVRVVGGADGRVAVLTGSRGPLRLAQAAPVFTSEDEFGGLGVHAASGGFRWGGKLLNEDFVMLAAGAFDAWGNLWVVGSFGPKPLRIDMKGEDVVVESRGKRDVFLLKLGPDGTVERVASFGDGREQFGFRLAVGGDGGVWLVGSFVGEMDFTGATLAVNDEPDGAHEMFVVKLDNQMTWQWGRAFGAEDGTAILLSVAADAAGDAVVAGILYGDSLQLGDRTLARGPGNTSAVVVAKLDGDGEVVWAHGWPCAGACYPGEIAIDGAGQAVMTVRLASDSAATVGDQPFSTVFGADVLVKLDRGGEMVWPPRAYASEQLVAKTAPTGEVLLAGSFEGSLALPAAPGVELEASGQADAFIAKLRP
jgi:hypothetical protein